MARRLQKTAIDGDDANTGSQNSKERRDKITSIIYNALSPPSQLTNREKTTISGTKIANNTTYTSIMDVLSQSEGLIKEYERLDGMIADLRSRQTVSVAVTWKHEIRETEEQLRKGARVAVRSVKKVLGADVGSDEEAEIQPGDEEDLNHELRGSLRYAERGIKRMAKALPHEKA
ncbi:hypothetical protein J1614_009963 [Plenodomus biglobosus]|nr:hypothetical protein J1614_009963 [Plenodomus biglobosus]